MDLKLVVTPEIRNLCCQERFHLHKLWTQIPSFTYVRFQPGYSAQKHMTLAELPTHRQNSKCQYCIIASMSLENKLFNESEFCMG